MGKITLEGKDLPVGELRKAILSEGQRAGKVSIKNVDNWEDSPVDHPHSSISIFLNKDKQGKGLGRLGYALAAEQSGLDEVYAYIAKKNLASIRAAEHAGFSRVHPEYKQYLMRWERDKTASINSIKYPGGVAPQFQGYVSQKRTKIITRIEDLPQPPYPANDSGETRKELHAIKRHMDEGRLPESLMLLADREPEKIFHLACEKFGIDPKADQASVIKEDFNKIAFDLKYIFKRPRPWSLAEHHGVNLNVTIPESADTPSYPSGHAMMGYGLAEFYKSHYPEYTQQWDKIADIIQHSRLQAGLHFPSDNKYSKDIVMEISKREKVASSSEDLRNAIAATAAAGALGYGGYKVYQENERRVNALNPWEFPHPAALTGAALTLGGAYLGRGKLRALAKSISRQGSKGKGGSTPLKEVTSTKPTVPPNELKEVITPTSKPVKDVLSGTVAPPTPKVTVPTLTDKEKLYEHLTKNVGYSEAEAKAYMVAKEEQLAAAGKELVFDANRASASTEEFNRAYSGFESYMKDLERSALKGRAVRNLINTAARDHRALQTLHGKPSHYVMDNADQLGAYKIFTPHKALPEYLVHSDHGSITPFIVAERTKGQLRLQRLLRRYNTEHGMRQHGAPAGNQLPDPWTEANFPDQVTYRVMERLPALAKGKFDAEVIQRLEDKALKAGRTAENVFLESAAYQTSPEYYNKLLKHYRDAFATGVKTARVNNQTRLKQALLYKKAELSTDAIGLDTASSFGRDTYEDLKARILQLENEQEDWGVMPWLGGAALAAGGAYLGRGKLRGLGNAIKGKGPGGWKDVFRSANQKGAREAEELAKLEQHLVKNMGYDAGAAKEYIRTHRYYANPGADTGVYRSIESMAPGRGAAKEFVFNPAKAEASAARFKREQEAYRKWVVSPEGTKMPRELAHGRGAEYGERITGNYASIDANRRAVLEAHRKGFPTPEAVKLGYMTKQARGWNLVSKVRSGAGRLRDAVTRRKAPANPNPASAESQAVTHTAPQAEQTVVKSTQPAAASETQVVQQTNPNVVSQTTEQTTQAAHPYAQQWREFYANARANPYSLLMSPTLRGSAAGAAGAYWHADQDRGQAALMGAILGAGIGRVAPGVLRHAGSKFKGALQAQVAPAAEQTASSGGFFSKLNPANLVKRKAKEVEAGTKSWMERQLDPNSRTVELVSRYGVPVGTGIAAWYGGKNLGRAFERDSSPVSHTTNNIISVNPEALKQMFGLDKLSSALEKRSSADYRPRGTLFLTDGKGNVMAGPSWNVPGSEATSPYYFPGGGVFEEEGVDRVPTKAELEEGIRREALEELGYSLKNYRQLKDTPTNLDMPEWWKERQWRKRNTDYKGLAEYYGTAEVDKEDMSLYDVEGDAFKGDWTPIEDVASALEGVDPDSPYGAANLEQARLLRSLQQKTAKDDHVELRRKERANHISKKRISRLREAIKETQQSLPKGTHHVKLDNASAVIKDVGKKHVLATLLAANMHPPGDDLSAALLKARRK